MVDRGIKYFQFIGAPNLSETNPLFTTGIQSRFREDCSDQKIIKSFTHSQITHPLNGSVADKGFKWRLKKTGILVAKPRYP
jgi:hypothetical protein